MKGTGFGCRCTSSPIVMSPGAVSMESRVDSILDSGVSNWTNL